jgi:hypothetical protein
MSGPRHDGRAPGGAPDAEDDEGAGWVEHDPASMHQDFMPEGEFVPDERAIDPSLGPPREAPKPAADDDWGVGETPPQGLPAVPADGDWFAGDAPKAAQVKARRVAGPPPPEDASAWLGPEEAPTVKANPPRPLPGAPPPSRPAAPQQVATSRQEWSGGGPRAVHVRRGQQGQGGAEHRPARRSAAPPGRSLQAWLAVAGTVLVVAGATAGLWFWRQRSAPPPVAATVAVEAPPTAVAPEKPPERLPAVVRSSERRTGSTREYTRVKVKPAPARFVSAETGEVLCESAEACSVPSDETVRVEAKGREQQILEPKALGAHAGGEMAVVLPPAKP